MHKILIIQDSPSVNAMLKFRLEKEWIFCGDRRNRRRRH